MTPGEAANARSELAVATDALRGAEALVDLGLFRDAASRLYYAAFHATRAALASRGVAAKTHAGQQRRFTEIFGPEPTIGRLLGLRAQADNGHGEFGETEAGLRVLAGEATALVERCQLLVAAAEAAGPDEPDPEPDL